MDGAFAPRRESFEPEACRAVRPIAALPGVALDLTGESALLNLHRLESSRGGSLLGEALKLLRHETIAALLGAPSSRFRDCSIENLNEMERRALESSTRDRLLAGEKRHRDELLSALINAPLTSESVRRMVRELLGKEVLSQAEAASVAAHIVEQLDRSPDLVAAFARHLLLSGSAAAGSSLALAYGAVVTAAAAIRGAGGYVTTAAAEVWREMHRAADSGSGGDLFAAGGVVVALGERLAAEVWEAARDRREAVADDLLRKQKALEDRVSRLLARYPDAAPEIVRISAVDNIPSDYDLSQIEARAEDRDALRKRRSAA